LRSDCILWQVGPRHATAPEAGRAICEIADALRFNCTLQSLQLAGCTVNNDGVRVLTDAIGRNKHSSLTALDLSRNDDINEDAIEALRNAKTDLQVTWAAAGEKRPTLGRSATSHDDAAAAASAGGEASGTADPAEQAA
jgi:hypothetical protein